MTLALIRSEPTVEQLVREMVTGLRRYGYRAIAAHNPADGPHAVVIIPPQAGSAGGQYVVIPTHATWTVRWRPKDTPPTPLGTVDSAAQAAALISAHMDGLSSRREVKPL